MMEVVDGEYQDYIGRDIRTPEEIRNKVYLSEEEDVERRGAYIREHFFNTPELKALVEHLPNARITSLKRGGHDPLKVYAAYKAAVEHKGQPTVILVKTVKGYGVPGTGASREEHHAPVEEARGRDREGAEHGSGGNQQAADGRRPAPVPRPLRAPLHRRSTRRRSRSTARRRQPRDEVHPRPARGAGRSAAVPQHGVHAVHPPPSARSSRGSTRARPRARGNPRRWPGSS